MRGSSLIATAAAFALLGVAASDAVDEQTVGVRGTRFAVRAVTRPAEVAKADTCACCIAIFADGFESGDTTAWSFGIAKGGEPRPGAGVPTGQRFRLVEQEVVVPPRCQRR